MLKFERCARVGLLALLGFTVSLSTSARPVKEPIRVLDPIRKVEAAAPSVFHMYALRGDNAISWATCGTVQGISGCYASGAMSGFSRACALMESAAATSGDTQTASIYVLDSGGTTRDAVMLTEFQVVDTIVGNAVTTTVTQTNSVQLPLQPGTKASCMLGGTTSVLFAGTSLSETAASISLPDLTVSSQGGFSPALPVKEITADADGWVAVTFVGTDFGNADTGFFLFGPSGEDGGGAPFIPNTINGVILP